MEVQNREICRQKVDSWMLRAEARGYRRIVARQLNDWGFFWR